MSQTKDILNRKWHYLLVSCIIVCSSYQVYMTTVHTLKHSRDLQRTFNLYLLEHDSLDIYWYGYRIGPMLINYPIQEYYFLEDVADFLDRLQKMLSNMQDYALGEMDQQQFNKIQQTIHVRYRDLSVGKFNWTIQEGLVWPLNASDIQSIKAVFSTVNSFTIFVNDLVIGNREWAFMFTIEPFEATSIFVTIAFEENLDLANSHILTFSLGLLLFISLCHQILSTQQAELTVSDAPDVMLCVCLIYTGAFTIIRVLSVHHTVLMDGVTCFISWLYILRFLTRDDDYHISFLIKKSYIYIGRVFVSFGPVFIGFCLFALSVFCRYSQIFVSLHKSFISLFCVSYYNLTYEDFRSTQKSGPISAIFFTIFVLLFTGCVYSGLLVSVFCSYVWNKRDETTKQQMLDSLKIQCLNCSHKYSYKEGVKIFEQKNSLSILGTLANNIQNPYTRAKYKQILIHRVTTLKNIAELCLEQGFDLFEREKELKRYRTNILVKLSNKTRQLLGIAGNKSPTRHQTHNKIE